MKNLFNSALLGVLILAIGYSIVGYGAATLEMAAPLFGAGALLALLWALKLTLSDKISWIKSPVHWPVLAFVAYAGIRYLTSPIVVDSRIEFFYVCFYALIYFTVACNLYHRRDLTILFLALMALVVGESIYGIWQAATKSEAVLLAERPIEYMGRASGTFVNPNHFAAFLAIVFGLLLARIVLHRPAAKATFGTYAGPKILEGYVALVAIAGIVASGSRGSWVGLAVGLIAFLMWAWLPGAVSKYVVAGIAFVIVLGALVMFSAPSVRERIAAVITSSKETGELKVRDVTLGHRTIMWSASTKMIAERPLFGSGPGTWEWFFAPHRDPELQAHPRNAHNDLLQLGAEYGAIGLLLVAAFFGAYFWHVAQLSSFANYSDQRAFAVGSGFAVAVVLLHGLADFHFHVPGLALLIIILIALAVGMESGDSHSVRVQFRRSTQYLIAVFLVIVAGFGLWLGLGMVKTQSLLTAANDLAKSKSFDQARDYYEQILKRDPKQYAAHQGLGNIFVALGQATTNAAIADLRADLGQRALDAYAKSEKLNPHNAAIYPGMARAHRLRNESKAAVAAYEKALTADPKLQSLAAEAGFYHRELGDLANAKKLFERSIQLRWTPEVWTALEAIKNAVQK